jgi:c-di-GMP-binding flagellar brake protein YcgR
MSPTSASPDLAAPLESVGRTDRRSAYRYPIVLRLQYKLTRNGRVERFGSGTTRNISSRGVLFDADDQLPARSVIELALHWPVLLQGSCGLKLVMRGRVVRVNEKAVAMVAEFHEFRTAGYGIARTAR